MISAKYFRSKKMVDIYFLMGYKYMFFFLVVVVLYIIIIIV